MTSTASDQFLKQNTFYWKFSDLIHNRAIQMPIGTNNWDVETYKNNEN